MHVNAKQAAKNVKMLPEIKNSVTSSLETLYKQLRASASI